MKNLAAALALLVLLASPAWAGAHGCSASSTRDNFATEFRKCLPLAQGGDVEAQNNLGFMYAQGRGVAKDYGQALKWFRMAAEQSDSYAQFHLGIMHENGQGVAQDYVQAHMWYSLAIANSTGGMRDMTKLSLDDLAGRMAPDQIARAQEMARNFKPR